MNDRELLELAAKAAGIDAFVLSEENDGTAGYWNPLVDDGDALRLAVKLGIEFAFRNGKARADSQGFNQFEERGDDPYAATRRAIVRAAAEIGKAMEG